MLFVTIFQFMMILGGVITIIGAIIFLCVETSKIAKITWNIVLIGAILGGGNILSFFAAVQIKKSIPSQELLKFIYSSFSMFIQ